MVKQVPITHSPHHDRFASSYETLQAAIDAAWILPGGHIHDESTSDADPLYFVEAGHSDADPLYLIEDGH